MGELGNHGKNIYPQPHTGAPLDATDSKDWMGVKGDESRLVRCRFCGWICDPDRDKQIKDGSFAGKGIDYLRQGTDISNMGTSSVGGTWTDMYWTRCSTYTAESDFAGRYLWAYLYPKVRGIQRVRMDVLVETPVALVDPENGKFRGEDNILAKGVYRNITTESAANPDYQAWYRFELEKDYSFTSGSVYNLAILQYDDVYSVANRIDIATATSGAGFFASDIIIDPNDGGWDWNWQPHSLYTSAFVATSSSAIPGNARYNIGDSMGMDYYYQPDTVGGCPCCGSYLYNNQKQ